MTLFAGIIIVAIVFIVIVYVLRAVGKNTVLEKKRRNSQNYFLGQVNNFAVSSLILFDQKEDLFSPSVMSNAGIEVDGEEIRLVDYIQNVPWFFYL